MDEAQVVRIMIFIAHQNSLAVLQPCKQPLNFPSPFIPAEFAPVLCLRFHAIRFMRSDQLDTYLRQFLVQRVRVIRLIANQSFGFLIREALDESFADKSDLTRRSRLSVDGDRKTSRICHCQQLRTFAPLGLSHFEPPFLATMNVPSMKHSDKSISPLMRRSSAKVPKTRSSRPSLTHCWKRRWQVWYGGNLSGRSHQRAPERRIHSTPLKTSRSGRRGLPRVCVEAGMSNNGSINAHCSPVNSSRRTMMKI
jgi:hypothetical protein